MVVNIPLGKSRYLVRGDCGQVEEISSCNRNVCNVKFARAFAGCLVGLTTRYELKCTVHFNDFPTNSTLRPHCSTDVGHGTFDLGLHNQKKRSVMEEATRCFFTSFSYHDDYKLVNCGAYSFFLLLTFYLHLVYVYVEATTTTRYLYDGGSLQFPLSQRIAFPPLSTPALQKHVLDMLHPMSRSTAMV